MTKEAALQSFWGSFGLTAYEENSVPTGEHSPEPPYITYQAASDSFGGEILLTGSIWDRSSSWLEINAKEREISKHISRGGLIIPCDGGALWIKRGSPFSTAMTDESDNLIKRKVINITVEYITSD